MLKFHHDLAPNTIQNLLELIQGGNPRLARQIVQRRWTAVGSCVT